MKIDGNRLTQDTEATKSAEAAQKVTEKRVAKKSDLPGAAGDGQGRSVVATPS